MSPPTNRGDERNPTNLEAAVAFCMANKSNKEFVLTARRQNPRPLDKRREEAAKRVWTAILEANSSGLPALSCAIPYCRLFVEAALRRRAPESSVLPDDKIEELFSRVLATWSIKADGVGYLRDSLGHLGRQDLIERLGVFLQRRDPKDVTGWQMQVATLVNRGAVVDAALAVERATTALPADAVNGLVGIIGPDRFTGPLLASSVPGKAGKTVRDLLSQSTHEGVRGLANPDVEEK